MHKNAYYMNKKEKTCMNIQGLYKNGCIFLVLGVYLNEVGKIRIISMEGGGRYEEI